MLLVVWVLCRSSLIYLQWVCTSLLVCLLVTEDLGPALISWCCHVQQIPRPCSLICRRTTITFISSLQGLQGKSDQTTSIHHKPPPVLQLAPQTWWHLEGTKRCFFSLEFEQYSAVCRNELSLPFLNFFFALSSVVGCCNYFSVALSAVSNMNLLQKTCHWSCKLTSTCQIW